MSGIESGTRVPVSGGVTGLAVGIETKGGAFTPLIDRGTAVPHVCRVNFTTGEDGQLSLKVRPLVGGHATVAMNQELGSYEIMLAELSSRGEPQIEVSFEVDAGGVFRLSARDGAGRDLIII